MPPVPDSKPWIPEGPLLRLRVVLTDARAPRRSRSASRSSSARGRSRPTGTSVQRRFDSVVATYVAEEFNVPPVVASQGLAELAAVRARRMTA